MSNDSAASVRQLFSQLEPLLWLVPQDDKSKFAISGASDADRGSVQDSSHFAVVPKPAAQLTTTEDGLVRLATLGKKGDVKLSSWSIGPIQCKFVIHPSSGFILLVDKSPSSSTSVTGQDPWTLPSPIQHVPRQVVLFPGKKKITLGMGGERKNILSFTLMWNLQHAAIKNGAKTLLPPKLSPLPPPHSQTTDSPTSIQQEHSSYAPTYLSSPSGLTATYPTNAHQQSTSSPSRLNIRGAKRLAYCDLELIGCGAFGDVSKAVNVHTGDVFAVKAIKETQSNRLRDAALKYLQREIALLARLQHPNVVTYVSHAPLDTPGTKFYMVCEEGSLHGLLHQGSLPKLVCQDLTIHLLEGLACIKAHNILHRDIKPENILYSTDPECQNRYIFKLSDFGLANQIPSAHSTGVGTRRYMAPEVYNNKPASHKSDVWAVYLTILEALDPQLFEKILRKDVDFIPAVVEWIRSVQNDPQLEHLQGMGAMNPEDRPDAKDVLERMGIH